MSKVPMRFITGMSPYQSGEVAGFDPAFAAELEKKGIAEKALTGNETKEAKPKVDKMQRTTTRKGK